MTRRVVLAAWLALAPGGMTGLAPGEAMLHVRSDSKKQPGGKSLVQTFSLASEVTSYGLTYDIMLPEGGPASALPGCGPSRRSGSPWA